MEQLKKLIIFGAGIEGRKALEWVGKDRVRFFVDNNTSLHDKKLDGIPVISFERLQMIWREYQLIIATTKYQMEISDQLEKAGISGFCSVRRFLLREKFSECANKEKRIILMNTHEYTNIGDHAISVAELFFIKEYLPEYTVVEVPAISCVREMEYLKENIKHTDIIMITGGGYLGTLWMEWGEYTVREIINTFPNNKVVILPQTIYFEDSEKGKQEKKVTSQIYNAHNHLYICVRDEKSYALSKELFDSIKVFFVPDIVTLLDRSGEVSQRYGVGLCLRNDIESLLSGEDKKQLLNLLEDKRISVKEFSMHAEEAVCERERLNKVNETLRTIQKSRVVITDRLHCMLLCAISGTPCVAMDNLSGKVKGVYEWIRHNEYVRCVDGVQEAVECMELLWDMCECKYDNANIRRMFQQLAEVIS